MSKSALDSGARPVFVDHAVGTHHVSSGVAINDLVNALDALVHMVEQPARRTLNEYFLVPVDSAA